MVWKLLKQMLSRRSPTPTTDGKDFKYPVVTQLPNGKWAAICQDGSYVDSTGYDWSHPGLKALNGMHRSEAAANHARREYLSIHMRA